MEHKPFQTTLGKRRIAPTVKPPTVAEVVTDELRRRLVRGDFAPGTHVKEADIARALGVSVTPVRHALHRLADEGLLELIPHCGATVKELTVEDFLELAEVREALEVVAFRKAAPNMTDEDLARLQDIHRAYHNACIQSDSQAAIAADLAFHEYVVERSGNRRLGELMRKLSVLRLCLEAQPRTADPGRWMRDKDCHLPLVRALAARDPEGAAEAIRQHIREGVRVHMAAWRLAREEWTAGAEARPADRPQEPEKRGDAMDSLC